MRTNANTLKLFPGKFQQYRVTTKSNNLLIARTNCPYVNERYLYTLFSIKEVNINLESSFF